MKKENKKYVIAGAALAVAAVLILVFVFINRGKERDGQSRDSVQNSVSGKQDKKGLESNIGTENTEPAERETGGEDEDPSMNEPIKAMYLTYGEGLYIFIDKDQGTLFTAPIPEGGLYGMNGQLISQDDLRRGNVLKIYGNNIMLESYPGQYPGVTKMELYEEGNPEDADQYNDLIDQIYQEPDPAEPPYLSIEYANSMAVVSASITRGGYSWSYEKEDGTTESAVADSIRVLEWKEIADLALNGTEELKLQFSREPQRVEAVRWTEDQRNLDQNAADTLDGEKVELGKSEDGNLSIKSPEPGYVYSVHAYWENGDVEYGFLTK